MEMSSFRLSFSPAAAALLGARSFFFFSAQPSVSPFCQVSLFFVAPCVNKREQVK